MGCCLDTNHFVGTPTFFRIILCIFTLWGKGKLFKLLVFSLLFSDHFVSPVADSLFSLNQWKREKIYESMSITQVSILGLLANDQATVPNRLPSAQPILCNPNRFIFGDNKTFWYLVVPFNNFASMNNCPWVQGKSNKPHPLPRCVCGGWGNSYSMNLPLFLLS